MHIHIQTNFNKKFKKLNESHYNKSLEITEVADLVMRRLLLDWINLAPLLKLLFTFIAFSCFGFFPIFLVSVLFKMGEHTYSGNGLKRGVDRLLVMVSLTAMVTWHYLGSITFLLISLLSLLTKLAISLLTTVRMYCTKETTKIC